MTAATVLAGSNVVATFCQYEALKYVSFPVQTLGKCAKMIPVMIWGTLVNQKSYKGKDYLIAMMITGGCILFAMTGRTQNIRQLACACGHTASLCICSIVVFMVKPRLLVSIVTVHTCA
jgi:hypothetical protein